MSKPLFPQPPVAGASANQMRYFHGVILPAVTDFVNSHGHDFDKSEAKQYLKQRFGWEKSMASWRFEEMDVFLDKVMDWLDANDIPIEPLAKENHEQTQETIHVRPS